MTFRNGNKYAGKLNPQKVRSIRAMHGPGENDWSVADLAGHFDVSEDCIRRVLQRKTWGDITDDEETAPIGKNSD